jgi:hypothetical protein
MGENRDEAARETARWDETLCAAVGIAAAKLAPSTDERKPGEERHLVPALRDALGQLVGASYVTSGAHTREPLPDWRPLPAPFDLLIGEPPSPPERPRVGIEAKSGAHRRKLGETPYEIFKLASLPHLGGVEAAYLVMAAPTAGFSGTEPGAELFEPPTGRSEDWYSAYLVEQWWNAWAHTLGDGSGRPLRVPRIVRLELVCIEPVPAFRDWEIRVLRVENPYPRRLLAFGSDGDLDTDPYENGPPQIRDARLRPEDVPRPDCDEPELHLFALSCNGYAREGNRTRCTRLADEARRRWEEAGEVPGQLRKLRSCLFFEQRRAQKSRSGFNDGDPRTLAYVRALVEGIRSEADDLAGRGRRA